MATTTLPDARSGEMTTAEIIATRAWDENQAAQRIDSRVREIENQHRRSFIETGWLCSEMSDRQLFLHIEDPETGQGFRSFDRWLMNAAPVSRSGAYAAMRAVQQLQDIAEDDLAQIRRCNAETLRLLPSRIRREPEVLEAAKTLGGNEFVVRLQELHPDQHLEVKRKLIFYPVESARMAVEQALALAGRVYTLQSREEALEAVCVDFLTGHLEAE